MVLMSIEQYEKLTNNIEKNWMRQMLQQNVRRSVILPQKFLDG